MDICIEQTVINKNKTAEKRRARIYRIIASVAAFILVIIDAFAASLLQVFYYTDKGMFNTFLVLVIAFSLPMCAFIFLLFWSARRYGVEFDYRLDGKTFNVYKCYGGSSQRHIAIVDLENVLSIGKVSTPSYFKQFPQGKRRKPVICCCNDENPNIYFMKVRFLGKNNSTFDRVLVIEPTKQMLDVIRTSALTAEKCACAEWTATDEVYAI